MLIPGPINGCEVKCECDNVRKKCRHPRNVNERQGIFNHLEIVCAVVCYQGGSTANWVLTR